MTDQKEFIETCRQAAILFLNEVGWKHIPDFEIIPYTDDLLSLGEYEVNSQFTGIAKISLNVYAISRFTVNDPQTSMVSTLIHELAHMAHEAAQYESDYPVFGDYFADEEDMCEWFCWSPSFGVETTIEHPFFKQWLKAVDNFYQSEL